ncbi:unnamed protein product [Cuscuta campestris]|uniref:CCHC-type domain-containing protein n=1 Tax=Cuscuta campestris TaxID=132261 RepID=A0A484MRE2_9ASTE|nr:unnamed protein product [Cuscuta campestris]
MDAKAIRQAHDIKNMTLDQLMGNLETIELQMNEEIKQKKSFKQIAFHSHTTEEEEDDEDPSDGDYQEKLPLITKQFKKQWMQKKRRTNYQAESSKGFQFRNPRPKESRAPTDDSKRRGPQCFECGGFGHIQSECANNLKKKRQAFVSTWSDEEDDTEEVLGNSNCAFTTQVHNEDPDSLTNQLVVLQKELDSLRRKLDETMQQLEQVEGEKANLNYELTQLKSYQKWMKSAGSSFGLERASKKIKSTFGPKIREIGPRSRNSREAQRTKASRRPTWTLGQVGCLELDALAGLHIKEDTWQAVNGRAAGYYGPPSYYQSPNRPPYHPPYYPHQNPYDDDYQVDNGSDYYPYHEEPPYDTPSRNVGYSPYQDSDGDNYYEPHGDQDDYDQFGPMCDDQSDPLVEEIIRLEQKIFYFDEVLFAEGSWYEPPYCRDYTLLAEEQIEANKVAIEKREKLLESVRKEREFERRLCEESERMKKMLNDFQRERLEAEAKADELVNDLCKAIELKRSLQSQNQMREIDAQKEALEPKTNPEPFNQQVPVLEDSPSPSQVPTSIVVHEVEPTKGPDSEPPRLIQEKKEEDVLPMAISDHLLHCVEDTPREESVREEIEPITCPQDINVQESEQESTGEEILCIEKPTPSIETCVRNASSEDSDQTFFDSLFDGCDDICPKDGWSLRSWDELLMSDTEDSSIGEGTVIIIKPQTDSQPVEDKEEINFAIKANNEDQLRRLPPPPTYLESPPFILLPPSRRDESRILDLDRVTNQTRWHQKRVRRAKLYDSRIGKSRKKWDIDELLYDPKWRILLFLHAPASLEVTIEFLCSLRFLNDGEEVKGLYMSVPNVLPEAASMFRPPTQYLAQIVYNKEDKEARPRRQHTIPMTLRELSQAMFAFQDSVDSRLRSIETLLLTQQWQVEEILDYVREQGTKKAEHGAGSSFGLERASKKIKSTFGPKISEIGPRSRNSREAQQTKASRRPKWTLGQVGRLELDALAGLQIKEDTWQAANGRAASKKKAKGQNPVRWSKRKTRSEAVMDEESPPSTKKCKASTTSPPTSSKSKKGKDPNHHSGKSSTSIFVTTAAKSYLPVIMRKNILPQRNIDLGDFALKTTLIPLLEARNLLKSVTLPGSYVKQVIHEFYCNLGEDFVNPAAVSFEKVFVRGKLYTFSSTAVNKFLGLDDDQDALVSEVTMWKELTHGTRKSQHPSNKVPSSILNSSYSILLRVAACHWLATSHTNTVTKAMGMLLYKIKNNVPVNLGKLIVAQIAEFGKHNYKQNDNGLPFPVLIFQMLVSQGFTKKDAEQEESLEPLLQIDNRHFEGKHFNDMVTAEQATHAMQGVLKYLEHKLQQNKEALRLVDQQRRALEEEHQSLFWLHEHVAQSPQAAGASFQGESTEEEEDNTTAGEDLLEKDSYKAAIEFHAV